MKVMRQSACLVINSSNSTMAGQAAYSTTTIFGLVPPGPTVAQLRISLSVR